MNLNRQILRIALPAIVSNITVPLLGLCDTAVSGHLGDGIYLGAIAVGTMAVNFIFMTLGFLRSGTTGLTAQAFGAKDEALGRLLFSRALLIGLGLGLLILLLHPLLLKLVMYLIEPEPDVRQLGEKYFRLVICSAPAMLATMAISGWFLGRQTSFQPMLIAILTNVLNIVLSLLFAFPLRFGFIGTGMGTLCANWCGLFIALWLVRRYCKGHMPFAPARSVFRLEGWGRFFNVNIFIFLRSFCIMAVSLGVTAMGARLGTDILAANAVIMQFFLVFSYFMDGFAFSAEALCGRAVGEKDARLLSRSIWSVIAWGAAVTLCFTIIYMCLWRYGVDFITDQSSVRAVVAHYSEWIWIISLAGSGAFIFDGVYIGLTATRTMMASTLLGFIAFLLSLRFMPGADNNTLWLAFTLYLLVRAFMLGILIPASSRHALRRS